VEKHFCATGFVVDGERTILQWHRKLKSWMPPGGHVEEDEDPIEALLREVREEAALETEVVSDFSAHSFASPRQLSPPRVILLEDISDGPGHQHIDLIYYLRNLGPVPGATPDKKISRWVTANELADRQALEFEGVELPIAEDVRLLAIDAIAVVRAADEALRAEEPAAR
jgi:ADP-ribose pyrophosphatase YjhB (NUDIX family)